MSQDIQERIQQILSEIAQWEAQKASGVSLATQAQIDTDIESAKKEIAKLEAEQQATVNETIQREQDSRVDGTVRSIVPDLEKIDFDGFNIRQWIPNSDDFVIYSSGMKQYIQDIVVVYSKEIAAEKVTNNELRRSFEEREIQLQRQTDSLQNKLSQRDLEYNDLEKRFTASANELEEIRLERDALLAQIQTLKKAPQEASEKTIAELEEENRVKEEAIARRRKELTIYDLQWVDDIKQNMYKAKLAATGEPLEFPWTEKTKYFVIDEAQVSQFREQYAISITPEVPNVAEASVQASTDVAQEQQFQVVMPPAVGPIEVSGESANSAVAQDTAVTESRLETRLAEFEAKLKAEIIAEIQGAA